MNIFKKVAVGVVLFALIAVPAVSSAQSAGDIESKIKSLYAQIEELKARLDAKQLSDTTGWKTYTNKKYRFEFKYPSGWYVKSEDFEDVEYFDGGDGTIINLGVIGSSEASWGVEIGPLRSIEKQISLITESESDRSGTPSVISQKKITIGDISAIMVIVDNEDIQEIDPSWQGQRILFNRGDRSYSISNGSVQSKEFDSFYRSFKFISKDVDSTVFPNACVALTRNLKVGDTGDDVVRLNQVLAKEGFSIDSKDIFTATTEKAVRAYQEKHRSEILTPAGLTSPTGIVGNATRAKLNSVYKCDAISDNQKSKISAQDVSKDSSVVLSYIDTFSSLKSRTWIEGSNGEIVTPIRKTGYAPYYNLMVGQKYLIKNKAVNDYLPGSDVDEGEYYTEAILKVSEDISTLPFSSVTILHNGQKEGIGAIDGSFISIFTKGNVVRLLNENPTFVEDDVTFSLYNSKGKLVSPEFKDGVMPFYRLPVGKYKAKIEFDDDYPITVNLEANSDGYIVYEN